MYTYVCIYIYIYIYIYVYRLSPNAVPSKVKLCRCI